MDLKLRQFVFPILIGLFVLRPVFSQQTQTQQPISQTPQASIPITCFQQIAAPSGFNNITFPNNQNQNQYQQPQQSYPNASLTPITCSTTTTGCFKMVCATGTTNYTIKGCQDAAQPQFACPALQNQCPGNQGQCLTCMGSNCNGASEMKIGMTSFIGFAMFSAISLIGFH